MTFDLSHTALREYARRRMAAALAAFDADPTAFLGAAAIADWIAQARKNERRERWLRAVIARRAATVYSGRPLREAGLNPRTLTGWDRLIDSACRARPGLRDAVEAAVQDLRKRITPEKQFPKTLKGAA